ncbi:MAG: helix-turn-helix transcriptional regulator [Syntrophomonadaceae bacterium]|nr:helix-turn-helix transcriptional regulator [Syntrophomonadaceae bacterium]
MFDSIKTGMLIGLVAGWVIIGPGYLSFISNTGTINISFCLAIILGFILAVTMLAHEKTSYFFTSWSWYYLSGAVILMLFVRLFVASHMFFMVTSFLLGIYVVYLLYKISILLLAADEPVYLVGSTLLVLSVIYYSSDIFLDIYPQHGDLLSFILSFSSVLFLLLVSKNANSSESTNTEMNVFIEGSTLKRLSLLLICFFMVFLIYTQGTIYFSNAYSLCGNYWAYILPYMLYFFAIILFSLYIRITNPSYLLGYCMSVIGCAVAIGMLAFEGSVFNYISLCLFSFCAAGVDVFTILMVIAFGRQTRQTVYILSGFVLYWFIIESSSHLGLNLSNSPAFYKNNLSAFIIIFILLTFPLLFTKRMSFLIPNENTLNEQIIETAASSCEENENPFMLTAAEKRVYQLICQGLSNADIADSLQISPNTVKFHVRNILQKAGVKNRRELLALTYNMRGKGTVLLSPFI